MIDRFTKTVLIVIALNLTFLSVHFLIKDFVSDATAQSVMSVRIVGGRLDYSTDMSTGPTLEVKAVR